MPTDLETTIRAALHERADAVVPVRTELGGRGGRRRWLPAALAAAAVAVLAVAISFAATRGSAPKAPAVSSADGIVGYHWRVTALQDGRGLLDVPSSLVAGVGFSEQGEILGDDTLNPVSGQYRLGDDGYHVTNVSIGLVGYAGTDLTRVRVIKAVDALFFADSGSAPGGTPDAFVSAHLDGNTLTLHTTGIEIITVTLTRDGVQPPLATAAPTTTPTK